jgi:hypothetical protein
VGENVRVLTYTRESRVIKEFGSTAEARSGWLSAGAFAFDTLERLNGYVRLDPGTYRCRMETSKSHPGRHQIRPLNHNKMTKGGTKAAILIHQGSRPSHFEGCIGIGFYDGSGNQLTDSKICMELLFDQCGGFEEGKEVFLRVQLEGAEA